MTKRQWDEGWECPHCKQKRGPNKLDPCLGELPGVLYGCCGHGGHGDTDAYLYFENGVRIGMVVTSVSYDDERNRIEFPGVKL